MTAEEMRLILLSFISNCHGCYEMHVCQAIIHHTCIVIHYSSGEDVENGLQSDREADKDGIQGLLIVKRLLSILLPLVGDSDILVSTEPAGAVHTASSATVASNADFTEDAHMSTTSLTKIEVGLICLYTCFACKVIFSYEGNDK